MLAEPTLGSMWRVRCLPAPHKHAVYGTQRNAIASSDFFCANHSPKFIPYAVPISKSIPSTRWEPSNGCAVHEPAIRGRLRDSNTVPDHADADDGQSERCADPAAFRLLGRA